jgi:elongation factor Ts
MKENIKALREMTGCGILDCRKALEQTGGSLDEAALWLRKNGMAKAAKKMDRDSCEGVIAVVTDGPWGAVVKVASETDFVARNEKFQAFVASLLDLIKEKRPMNLGDLLALTTHNGETVSDSVAQMTAVIGESIKLTDFKTLSVPSGLVASYIHNAYTPAMGRIGVLVALSSDAEPSQLTELGKHLSMHVAASKPRALNRDGVDQDYVAKEKSVYREEAEKSGKPEAAMDKIVDGRLKKLFSEIVFLEQPFIMDNKKTVETHVKEYKPDVMIHDYTLFMIG